MLKQDIFNKIQILLIDCAYWLIYFTEQKWAAHKLIKLWKGFILQKKKNNIMGNSRNYDILIKISQSKFRFNEICVGTSWNMMI